MEQRTQIGDGVCRSGSEGLVTESDKTETPSDQLTIDDLTVGIEWWATFWNISKWRAYGIVAGGNDRRIPPPLAIDGPMRWLRASALAYVEGLK